MGIRVVLIEAWTWGSTRRPQGDVSPRFYATVPLACGVARLLLREDTAQPEPAGCVETREGLSLWSQGLVQRTRNDASARALSAPACVLRRGMAMGSLSRLTFPRLSTLDTSCSADFPFPCGEMEGKQNLRCFSLYAVS